MRNISYWVLYRSWSCKSRISQQELLCKSRIMPLICPLKLKLELPSAVILTLSTLNSFLDTLTDDGASERSLSPTARNFRLDCRPAFEGHIYTHFVFIGLQTTSSFCPKASLSIHHHYTKYPGTMFQSSILTSEPRDLRVHPHLEHLLLFQFLETPVCPPTLSKIVVRLLL